MTDTQLKPCPFCGAAGVKNRDGYYTCSNDHCNLVTMSDGWNYRPIEDALQARIAELELILAADKLIEDGWIGRIEAGDKRIAELEAENAKLRASAVMWHKYPDEKPPIDGRYLFWDSDGNAPHVLPYNDIVVRDNPGVFSTQTHWAYLPVPPKGKKCWLDWLLSSKENKCQKQ